MRADRLISILMLLQIYKKLTALELSKKLEVSVRTIYRDIDSLSGIGIPIVTEKGINGGITLLGNYKTTLTGINRNELLSLFIPTGDKIFEDLGIENLKNTTILKILGNSSPDNYKEFENFQNYIYIDMNTWNNSKTSTNKDVLSTLQKATWSSKSLKMCYKKIDEKKEITINPLGLVCKRSIWYLVAIDCDTIKTYKISSIESATLTNDKFTRPSEFNLKNYWENSVSKFKTLIPKYNFIFKINPNILESIKERPFITIKEITHRDDEPHLYISFDSLWQGIEFAFSYGKDIKIIEPFEAITEIKKKSLEIIDLY
ncbi:helix-turn-helix transcriptional regulator [Clostridium intestinale]|uniref:helix-turn-helix transcriptional regulator n=1 Tax=Clostridium intestinale TaxID=36845 RepID=UPI002DD61F0F|nr:WYL domain-containing protein [Clostridium intestinale]WRY52728.1 WYL domain-containing protein [Clostridium intestinale]